MKEEKKRKGNSSNKSVKAEKEVVLDNKVEASNTVELDVINEDKEENKKVVSTNEQKININPTTKKKTKNKEKSNKKVKISKQMIGLIVIIISCIVITVSLVVLKIRDINLKYKVPEEDNVFVSENKKQDDELKFVVGENDTLDYNNLEYKDLYIIDGNEVPEDTNVYEVYGFNYSTKYQYLKISGLKDKDVENKINEKIKNYVSSINNGYEQTDIYSHTVGNYNNILSISIQYYNNDVYMNEGINFDLNTGDEFKLEDVFTKSASIVNILYTGLCERLAWNLNINYNDFSSDEEYFKKWSELSNMDNRDTSYYEDMIFKLSNWYKANKGKINFSISPTQLYVYNVTIDGEVYNLTIPLYKFKDSVAIYKRYSSADTLFDNNKYGTGYIPFSMPMSHFSNCLLSNKIDYGKKSSNLFIDVCLGNYSSISYEKLNSNIYNSLKIFTNNLINEVTKKASSNLQNGYILQAESRVSDYTKEWYTEYYNDEIGGYPIPHYRVILGIYEVELPIDNYKKNLNLYLTETAVLPRASAEAITIRSYLLGKGIISGPYDENRIYYFDTNGNYLGDDISVIKDTTRDGYNPS